jgi:hypothetical protein
MSIQDNNNLLELIYSLFGISLMRARKRNNIVIASIRLVS